MLLPMFLLSALYSQNLQKTSVQLMWLDQFEFAGFYVAKEKGFYEKAGLDVEIKKYDNSTNVLNEVLEKRADFGLNSTSLIIQKSSEKDLVIKRSCNIGFNFSILTSNSSCFKKFTDQ